MTAPTPGPGHGAAASAAPSRDDTGTTPCPVCQHPFAPAGRQAYCSPRCRKTAFRRRHASPAAVSTVPPARPRNRHAVYECPDCGQRHAGQQRCDDCGIFGRKIGAGGTCPHCSEPVTISDLLDGA